jgi:hypothetical protein
VVALVTAAGGQREMDRYSAYGVPFGLPTGDCDSDGDCDTTDRNQVQTWIDVPNQYDVRGDIDLDGDADSTDKTNLRNNFEGVNLGWKQLSASGVRNSDGAAAIHMDSDIGLCQSARRRVGAPTIGVWGRRDKLMMALARLALVSQGNLYELLDSRPQIAQDPLGRKATTPDSPSGIPPVITTTHDPWLKGCCEKLKDEVGSDYFGYTACCGNFAVSCTWNRNEAKSKGRKFAGEMFAACARPHEEEHKTCCRCLEDDGITPFPTDNKIRYCQNSLLTKEDRQACCAKADKKSLACLQEVFYGDDDNEGACDGMFTPGSREHRECQSEMKRFIGQHPVHGEGGTKCGKGKSKH